MRKIWMSALAGLMLSAPMTAHAEAHKDAALHEAVSNPARNKSFVARDDSRNPEEVLSFFGLKPDMAVLEIWPGKGYWTEILAPYLHDKGTYYVALPTKYDTTAYKQLLASDKDVYGKIKISELDAESGPIAPPESVDAVLTFRNLHNWMEGGYEAEALKKIHTALKPGGIFGVEDHRGLDSIAQDLQTKDGYVQEKYAIELIEKAGFEFVGSSPVNNNPKDTKRWPKGVWTLPPSLKLGDQDRAKYQAIGEADNFVLLFRKPVKAE